MNSAIRDMKRLPYETPVQIQWVDSERQYQSTDATTCDVSVYGLGVLMAARVPVDQELTVTLKGVEVCGGAVLRHFEQCSSGFRVGLYLKLGLFMQNIPGLDQLLEPSLLNRSVRSTSVVAALVQRFAFRAGRFAEFVSEGYTCAQALREACDCSGSSRSDQDGCEPKRTGTLKTHKTWAGTRLSVERGC